MSLFEYILVWALVNYNKPYMFVIQWKPLQLFTTQFKHLGSLHFLYSERLHSFENDDLNIIISNCIFFNSCDVKQPLLQSSVSHDPSKMVLIYWFAAQETFLIIINVENSRAA